MIDAVASAVSEGRRRFLRWATGLVALLSAVLAGVPALRAFLSPAYRRPQGPDWVKLGEADLFDLGTPTKVDFVEAVTDAWVENRVLRDVWVYTEDGEKFTVYNGRCTHLGCGYAWDPKPDPSFHPEANVFHCPCHHAIYEVTGEVIRGPAPRPLDTLDTKVEDGFLYAAYQDFRVGIPQKIPV